MKKNSTSRKKANKDTLKNFDNFDGFVSKRVIGRFFSDRLNYWTKKLRGV